MLKRPPGLSMAMTKPTIGAGHGITIAELVAQSLTQKPDYEITGKITTSAKKEESADYASNSGPLTSSES